MPAIAVFGLIWGLAPSYPVELIRMRQERMEDDRRREVAQEEMEKLMARYRARIAENSPSKPPALKFDPPEPGIFGRNSGTGDIYLDNIKPQAVHWLTDQYLHERYGHQPNPLLIVKQRKYVYGIHKTHSPVAKGKRKAKEAAGSRWTTQDEQDWNARIEAVWQRRLELAREADKNYTPDPSKTDRDPLGLDR